MSTALPIWMIRAAYAEGAFPMAGADGRIDWYAPYRRAIFPLDGLHVSRSLDRVLRRGRFEVTFDSDFEAVVRGCMRPEGTWINETIVEAFTECHRQGWAHSCEVWREGRLVGGIYGLSLGTCFSAESMFHRETNASKIALVSMIRRCRDRGYTLFDAQVMNPHLASMGAVEIDQDAYLDRLRRCMTHPSPPLAP